jgi:hypothetical protein
MTAPCSRADNDFGQWRTFLYESKRATPHPGAPIRNALIHDDFVLIHNYLNYTYLIREALFKQTVSNSGRRVSI